MTKLLVGGLLLMAMAIPAGSAADWNPKEQPDLKATIEAAKELTLEDVCAPITTTSRGELMRVPNPDGKSVDLLQWYYRAYGGPTTVVIMDTGSGEVKQDHIPDNLQIHICGRVVGKDGKLYFATPWAYRAERKGMELFVYDPAANKLTSRGVVADKLDGENRPMCVGTDGKIYGTGSYPDLDQPGAYQIDTDTGKTTDYGPIGPSQDPNGCWAKDIAADERYVYVATAHNPKNLIALDRETRTWKLLLSAENVGGALGVRQLRYGCSGSAAKVVGSDGQPVQFWLYQGQVVYKKDPNEPPPWKQPAQEEPWVKWPQVEVYDENLVPRPDGAAEIWYRLGGAPATAGAPPEGQGWKAFRFQVPIYPMSTHHIVELPDGRIYGAAGAYQGNFVYDPAAGRAEHLGKIHLSQYSTAVHKGKIYMSGYPSSPLYVYDLNKPWTANTWAKPGQPVPNENNPTSNPYLVRVLRDFAGTHEMVSAVVGADEKVYFGGMWIRDGSGGGFAWWDTKEQNGGGFWREFSNYRISNLATAADGKLIVISTSAVTDTVLGKPTPEQGKLFVFDTAEQKIVREIEPVLKARSTGPIACAGGTRIIGWLSDPAKPAEASILYGVDAATGEVAFRKALAFPFGLQQRGSRRAPPDFRLGPDGRIWTYMEGALVRINPEDASVEVVGKVAAAGHMAFSKGDLYLSGAEQLRRLKGAYKP